MNSTDGQNGRAGKRETARCECKIETIDTNTRMYGCMHEIHEIQREFRATPATAFVPELAGSVTELAGSGAALAAVVGSRAVHAVADHIDIARGKAAAAGARTRITAAASAAAHAAAPALDRLAAGTPAPCTRKSAVGTTVASVADTVDWKTLVSSSRFDFDEALSP